MARLTKARRETLEAIADWSAPFEVAERRRAKGSNVFARRADGMLRLLVKWGLAKYGPQNNTYRITDAGRAALKDTPNGQ
jgi:predicted transcriptional regulator